MREEGIQGKVRRRFKTTTMSDHTDPIAPNVLDRDFTAAGPNQRWVGDTSEFLIGDSGAKLYLAAILDLYSRFVVGCQTSCLSGKRSSTLTPPFKEVNTVLKAHGIQVARGHAGRVSAENRGWLREIDLNFHDLRHEAGSRKLESGWQLHDVALWLGHTKITTTSTYLNASTAAPRTERAYSANVGSWLNHRTFQAPFSPGPREKRTCYVSLNALE